jgi:hypothetical protein
MPRLRFFTVVVGITVCHVLGREQQRSAKMNDRQIDDFLDRLASEVGVKKLMKLSKAEILTLAKHYENACAEEYFEGKQYANAVTAADQEGGK